MYFIVHAAFVRVKLLMIMIGLLGDPQQSYPGVGLTNGLMRMP